MDRSLVTSVLLFLGTMHFASSENPDPLGLLYHEESKNSSPSTEDNFHLGGYDTHLEEKNIEKRRWVYKEPDDSDPNSPGGFPVRYPEIREYPPRNKNHSPEVEVERRGFDWKRDDRKDEEKSQYSYGASFDQGESNRKDEEKSKYSYGQVFDQGEGNRGSQFYKERTALKGRFPWRNMENVGEERQPLTIDTNRYKDYSADVNGYDRRNFAVDPRLTQSKHYDDNDSLRTSHSLYTFIPKMNYNGLHNMECCGSDKPLIINVNTDCFPPNKSLYYQRLFTQKPSLNTQAQSSYQIPDTTVLSSGNQGYYPSFKR